MNIKKAISNNLSLKILALILSILLWFYIYFVYGAKINKTASIQVQLINVPQDLSVNLSSNYIDVVFAAPVRIIEQVEKNIRIVMDLSGIGPGTFTRKINVEAPKEAEIISINPDEIEITIERIITKEFSIRGVINGSVANGNIIGKPEIIPQVVTVQGVESIVNSVKEAIVEINVDGATSDIYGSSEIKLINKSNERIEDLIMSSRIASFHVPVISSDLTKFVPVIPKFKGYPKLAIKEVKITPQIVKITGKGEIISKISSIETEPINIDGLSENISINNNLILPEGLKVEPISVKVEITVEAEITVAFDNVLVKTINLKDGLKASLDVETVKIVITGRSSIVENVKSLEAQLDLNGLDTGEYILSVKIKNIPDSLYVRIYPEKINVKITK
ncbi:MAG TPA: CdaR family protein [Caldisericia bacterium]|nr:CdaR family protein [Caldisericia bacterium]HOW03225.1 CdaR family protein [Caldisericia bacterium]HPO29132.1 CdaR family protein [Caldisericia bacterium]HQG82343.1 CdaR family protein [Caldisericia bacterium]